MAKEKTRRTITQNEIFQTSHQVLLNAYTVFTAILIVESLLLSWETWVLPMMVMGVIVAWGLHISQIISTYYRIWIYVSLIMATFFYYGIHSTSTFDMTVVMAGAILICIMTGIEQLVTLCQFTYCLTLAYDIYLMIKEQVVFDRLSVSRILLHIGMIYMVGRISRVIMRKWASAMDRTEKKIRALGEASERMDDFLANVSHEIRTPVNAVIGLTSVNMNKIKDSEILKDMTSVRDAGYRVADQIGDILDYTEIDMGKLTVNIENYTVQALVNDVTLKLQELEHPGVEIVMDIDPALPYELIGDVGKIKKILRHLLSNALKFTSKGGVCLRIFSTPREYGINLGIEVSDTGIGMDEKEIDRIYEKFYQSDSGRTRSAGGLGLGMAIVHGFVKAMDGFLSVKSEKGAGTTVHVSIPQKVGNAEPCAIVENRENLCPAGFLRMRSATDPQTREFYNEMLANMVKGLHLTFRRVEKEFDLRKLDASYRLTHLFVGEDEYVEYTDYIESMAFRMKVVVLANEYFDPGEKSEILVLPKPFNSLSIAKLLMTPSIVEGEVAGQGRFTCPDVRVLVVDDEPMNLLVANGILKDYEIQVDTASSGLESIAMCEKNSYDIVFMDHMMPEMDGIEAMKRIRYHASRVGEEISFVALTANVVSSARDMFLAEGFDGFIPKPIEIVELERVLKSILPRGAFVYEKNRDKKPKEEPPKPEPAPTVITDHMEVLKAAGINTVAGLEFCQDDQSFYGTILEEYVAECEEKKREMEQLLEAKDWENYRVHVHAVKSTSRLIGADALFDKLQQLENAAKKQDEAGARTIHGEAMKLYDQVVEAADLAVTMMKGAGE